MKRTNAGPMIVVVLLLVAMMAALGRNPAEASEFIPLGVIDGGGFGSEAWGMDDVGATVVGSAAAPLGSAAFRWTESQGMEQITGARTAYAVSGNGSVVVGDAVNPDTGVAEPFIWSAADGLQLLGLPAGETPTGPTSAAGVSADGSVVVGTTLSGGESQAFRWTEPDGFAMLDSLGLEASAASGVSDNGTVVVGTAYSSGEGVAFRWTLGDGTLGLGSLVAGGESQATAVSGDGNIVVGASDAIGKIREAFVWSADDGMHGLGVLESGHYESVATATANDGRAVVGISGTAGPSQVPEAFVWTRTAGMLPLQDILEDRFNLGAAMAGWSLTAALDISADGRFLVGRGVNPLGHSEAWLVRLDSPIVVPEPTGLSLVICAIVSVLLGHVHSLRH